LEECYKSGAAAQMGFLWRVNGATLRDKSRRCEICKTYAEPLLWI